MSGPQPQQLTSPLQKNLPETSSGPAAAIKPETSITEKKKNKRPSERERKKQQGEARSSAGISAPPKPEANASKMSQSPATSPHNKKKRGAKSKTTWMKNDAGEVVRTMLLSSMQLAEIEVSSESGFDVLCTYNWHKNGKAILVPGKPPVWAPPPLPVTLRPDSGKQFVDQHASHVPKYPFEPSFQALSVMNPGIRLDGIDIIVNRNSLRKLLDFVSGKRQDPFRMDLHIVNDTLFISRKERLARQIIHGHSNSGYGHNLEKAFTKCEDGLDHSSSHHRVIRYHLGHLNCIVRFEVDAYYNDTHDPNTARPSTESIDVLASTMESLVVHSHQKDINSKDNTQVILKGTPISSSKLAEIKARKAERIGESMPQLWFGRTPYLITGKHTGGVFHTISTSNVGLRFAAWEAANQEKLRKLVNLLAELKKIVRGTKTGAAMLLREDRGAPLEVLEIKNNTGVLPDHLITKFWGSGGG